ncbi:MAG: MFS transporter [Calditrichaeota bacterium]|nr:MAG: MFS transporter [Calditrichota bacterium]
MLLKYKHTASQVLESAVRHPLLQRFQGVILGSIFFVFYFGLSCWLPFFNIYLKQKGFSGAQVGIIAGLYQSVLFFVVPVWGIIADRFGNRRVLHIVLFCAMILVWGMRLISAYHLFILYVMIFAFMHHPLGMLSDSLAIGYIKQHQRAAFGEFRVWGSVGWAIGNVLMGRYLLTHELSLTFQIAAVFYGITWLTIWLFHENPGSTVPSRRSPSELKSLFANKKMALFLLLLLLYGTGISPLYVFINLYYRDIGAGNQMIGLGFALQAFSEVPFFFMGASLVKRFGAHKVLLFSMTTAVIRLVLYGIISHPIPALLIGLGSGITYSLFWVAIVDMMHGLIPEKWRATAQSLLWAVHVGCGVTIGNISIGILSDWFHMRTVMLMAGGVTSLVLLGMVGYFKSFRLSQLEPLIVEKEIVELPHVIAEE